MAILNTRNVFGPPAWAPVVNNVVAIATLGLYLAVPGELSVDPVKMGNPKLLVLGIGTTLGCSPKPPCCWWRSGVSTSACGPSGESTSGSSDLARWPPRWCCMC
ncbi:hypothetical protein NIIDMKKI_76910 [Mycobacterium kansasii]|uniref:Uncharacterized protein n=1 Tax=Mycobacterium kansasii TaxID=1768 RepID=A0A7G1IRS8_MYCKA|nr:hypothetical protein NIIDMKKI_76910 [Mycobacterium kansasii]